MMTICFYTKRQAFESTYCGVEECTQYGFPSVENFIYYWGEH